MVAGTPWILLHVARAVILGIVAILLGLFGSEFIGRLVAGQPLLGDYVYGSRFKWILLYGAGVFFLVASVRMTIAVFFREGISFLWGIAKTI